MPLSGPTIKSLVLSEGLIDPFDPACVGPCSYDLRLAPDVKVHRLKSWQMGDAFDPAAFLDMRLEPEYDPVPIRKYHGAACITLVPGMLYLGHTVERVKLVKLAGLLVGRSTGARYGLSVESAGFVDDGFEGQLVLEMQVSRPLIVYIGDRICQIAFEPVQGARMPYGLRGHYQGQTGPRGPRPIDRIGHGSYEPVAPVETELPGMVPSGPDADWVPEEG